MNMSFTSLWGTDAISLLEISNLEDTRDNQSVVTRIIGYMMDTKHISYVQITDVDVVLPFD